MSMMTGPFAVIMNNGEIAYSDTPPVTGWEEVDEKKYSCLRWEDGTVVQWKNYEFYEGILYSVFVEV